MEFSHAVAVTTPTHRIPGDLGLWEPAVVKVRHLPLNYRCPVCHGGLIGFAAVAPRRQSQCLTCWSTWCDPRK